MHYSTKNNQSSGKHNFEIMPFTCIALKIMMHIKVQVIVIISLKIQPNIKQKLQPTG
jgi:hypothetical protein